MKLIISLSLLIQSFGISAKNIPNVLEVLEFNSPENITETCEIAPRLFGLNYTGGAYKEMKALCEIDFYEQNDKGKYAALCAKTNSTNPAVNIYKASSLEEKELLEKNNCTKDLEGEKPKKISKFKQSITCSYFPSKLAYFHLSQFFGKGLVPAAVYRTMDKSQHLKVAKTGVSLTASKGGAIASGWKKLKRYDAMDSKTIAQQKNFDRLFTGSWNQLLQGELSENPRGEEKYSEIMGRKNKRICGYDERVQCFMNDTDSGFPYLSSSKSIASRLADLNYQNKIQLIQKLQDVSAMLVMDYLTSQQDRFGNQHYVLYHRYQTEQGEFKKVKAKKYSVDHENKLLVNKKDESKTIAFQDIAENIKVLMLKDNDCGVIKSNKVKNNRMLNKLRHMDYDLYQKVLLLSEKLKQTESQDYFKKYAKYSNWEAQKLQKDASDVSNLLKTHCKNGHLKLDLGFEQALGGQSQYDTTDCELNSKYLMHSLYNINFDFDAILYKI